MSLRRLDKKVIKAVHSARKRRRAGRWDQALYAGFDAASRGMVAGRLLVVSGMRRSGNHAIINWVLHNAPKPSLFLNCVRTGHHLNPLVSCGQVEAFGPDGSVVIEPEDPDKGEKVRHLHLAHPHKALTVVSYEDHPLRGEHLDTLHDQASRWLGSHEICQHMLIMRDPFNLFASRLHKYGAVPTRIVDGWMAHARAWVEDTGEADGDLIKVNYNRWCVDDAYRRALAETLGLDDWQRGGDQVSGIGGGSSFDGTAYHGDAARMRTDERWRKLIDDPRYLGLFNDEVLELSRAVFGPMPDAESAVTRGGASVST